MSTSNDIKTALGKADGGGGGGGPLDKNNNPDSEFVLGLFFVKLLVLVYSVITFPFFYVFQQPWKQLEANAKERARLENANDPGSPYVRTESVPRNHYSLLSETIPEQQRLSVQMNPAGMCSLGYRKVSDVTFEQLPNGKKMNKYDLTDYHWLTISEVDDQIGQLARGFLQHDVTYQSHVLIFAETRIGKLRSTGNEVN